VPIGTGLYETSVQSGSGSLAFPFEDALADVLAPWVEDSAAAFWDADHSCASASTSRKIEIGDGVKKAVKSPKQPLAFFVGHEEGLNPSDTSVTLDGIRCSSARCVRKPRLAVQQTRQALRGESASLYKLC
jgi:hypothetical protein